MCHKAYLDLVLVQIRDSLCMVCNLLGNSRASSLRVMLHVYAWQAQAIHVWCTCMSNHRTWVYKLPVLTEENAAEVEQTILNEVFLVKCLFYHIKEFCLASVSRSS